VIDFLKKVPCSRFGGLLTDLDNHFSRGADQYLKDLVEAYVLLVNYQLLWTHMQKQLPEKPEGATG